MGLFMLYQQESKLVSPTFPCKLTLEVEYVVDVGLVILIVGKVASIKKVLLILQELLA